MFKFCESVINIQDISSENSKNFKRTHEQNGKERTCNYVYIPIFFFSVLSDYIDMLKSKCNNSCNQEVRILIQFNYIIYQY